MLEQEVQDADSFLVVPIVVAPQALSGGANDDEVRAVLRTAHLVAPVDLERAEHAARLMRATDMFDVVDALVAVEALRQVPAIVITSDKHDLRRLLDADPAGKRVQVWGV